MDLLNEDQVRIRVSVFHLGGILMSRVLAVPWKYSAVCVC